MKVATAKKLAHSSLFFREEACHINKIKDIVQQLIRELSDYLKEKWNGYPNKWLLASLVVIYLYSSGIIAQIMRNRSEWTPGIIAVSPSFNPFKALRALFSGYGLAAMLGVLLLSVVGLLLIYMNKQDRTGQTYDKKRKIWFSDKGVHGSTQMMTQKEQLNFFELTPLLEIDAVEDVIYCITEDGKVISRKSDIEINRHVAVLVEGASTLRHLNNRI